MAMQPPPTKSTPPPAAERHRLWKRLTEAVELPQEVIEHPATPRILMLIIGLTWGLLLLSGTSVDPEGLQPGEIAPRTVRSPTNLIVEDPEATEKTRQNAVDAVLPVVDALTDQPRILRGRVEEAFEVLRSDEDRSDEELKSRLEDALGVPVSASLVARLQAERDNLGLELKLKHMLEMLDDLRIADDPDRWPILYPRGVTLRFSENEETRTETVDPAKYERILSADEAVAMMQERLQARFGQISRAERSLIVDLLQVLVEPNLRPNPIETEAARKKAAESVKPVLFRLKAGEVVVRSGERITPEQKRRLVAIHEHGTTAQVYVRRAAKIVLVILAVFLLLPYAPKSRWRAIGHPQDLLFLLVVSAVLLLLIRVGRAMAEPVVFAIPELPREAVLLLLPFATPAMICRLFFRPRIAFAIAVLFAVATAIFVDPFLLIMPFALLGGITGIRRLRHSKRRTHFQAAGLFVGLVQTVIWFLYALMDPGISMSEALYASPLPLVGGFVAAILASTLMPLGEFMGRYVSEIRLLELAQDDQPLLKWLHLNAPGSFNHSIAVGRLAEAAAERIGADALLARVGAYYHDIGKGFWPQYFVENQRGGVNPHEKLKPQLSARVIIAHVTKGAELAEKHHLPPAIIDFIKQHHGTSRVEYFYQKAMDEADSKESEEDSMFRYPGPKPQTKEAALIMLADVTESALRTLETPTPDRIHAFVSRLVEKVYTSNELDESPLTLNDLSQTIEAFVELLVGMYHHRIDYPHGLKPGQTTPVAEVPQANAG